MRCPEHGLAVGPQGTCVLCRRAAGNVATASLASARGPADTSWLGPLGLILGLVAIAIAGNLGVRSLAGLGPFAPADARERAAAERERANPRSRGEVPERLDDEGEQVEAREPGAGDLAAAMREVPVTVYFTTWCPHCKRARDWLEQRGVPYEAFDVEKDPAAAREMRKVNPRGGVPTLVIDGEVMVGFDPRACERRLTAAAERRLAEP